MRCPHCEKTLIEKQLAGIRVDHCQDGCGGLWFDNFELAKLDEPHEAAGEALTAALPPHPKPFGNSAKRPCPKCDGVIMRRFFASIKREVEIDECPQCGGTWLDAGELAILRGQYATEAERRQAAQAYFSKTFDQSLHAEASRTALDTADKERLARSFKYVLPSYWLPGKQSGGAF